MGLFVTIFSLILIVIAVGLAFCKPMQFTFFWVVFGCSYDSCGIVRFLEQYFGYYGFLMNTILLFACISSIFRFCQRNHSVSEKRFLITASLFILGIFISQLVVYTLNGISMLNLVYGFTDYGPPIFIIWLTNFRQYNKNYDSREAITKTVSIQILIACLIVYLPMAGIHTLDGICGDNFIADGYVYNRNVCQNLLDIPKMFVNKYLFNGLGQFHNGNDMGFYGAWGLFLAVYMIMKDRRLHRILWAVALAYCSLLLWGNSGMRGPIVGLGCGAIVAFLCAKKRSKWIVGIFGILAGGLVMISEVGSSLLSYLIPSFSNISFSSRTELRNNGFSYIAENWLIGAGGLLSSLTSQRIDPHELPLRISCMFGVFTGIMCTLLIYVQPIITFFKTRFKDLFVICAWFVIFFISITNNYTDPGLFWILFSESICSMLTR